MENNNSYKEFDIGIIGAGILGTALAYSISSAIASNAGPRSGHNGVVLFEQEHLVGRHSSSRNTGKVHAPFLYDPCKKKLFAKAALMGFDMIRNYCIQKRLPFKHDGVLEVATHEKGIDKLHNYQRWGYSNGLREDEIKFYDKTQVKEIEPNVNCLSAIYCSRDASVDYGLITEALADDAQRFGCTILTNTKVVAINDAHVGDPYSEEGNTNTKKPIQEATNRADNRLLVSTIQDHNRGGRREKFSVDFLINAAGGNSIDLAHSLGIAYEFTDLHFRGEYWQAPHLYSMLTKMSIYSVPKLSDYPFLNPHWIVRVDGRKEVGPNAVPVFSPYAYSWSSNLQYFIPKLFESSSSAGLRKILFDREFLSLVGTEIKSSLSKRAMINRAREFLPQLDPSKFTLRGTAGIRSSLIDRSGKFVNDTLILANEKSHNSLHILNYNSPGATGALPISAMIVKRLIQRGIIKHADNATEMMIGGYRIGDIDGDLA